MFKLAKELEFISQINWDGSGVTAVSEEYLKSEIGFTKNYPFELIRLSLTEETFIAFGFNAFVVKLKKQ